MLSRLAKKTEVARCPERAALAAAIDNRIKAERAVEAANRAFASIETMTRDAEAELESLRESIKRDDLTEVQRALSDGCVPRDVTVASREREAGLLGRLASCNAHRPACEAARDEAAYDLHSAEKAVEAAIPPVELLRIRELAADLTRSQIEVRRKFDVVQRLARHYPNIHFTTSDEAPQFGDDAYTVRESLHVSWLQNVDTSSALAPWLALREALKNDPDAELPQ